MYTNQSLRQKLQTIAAFCIISIIAGIIFQFFEEGFVNYNAFIIGLFIGIGFGLFEIYLMPVINQRFKSSPLLVIIIINISLYALLIFLISSLAGFIVGGLSGRTLNEFFDSIVDVHQFYLIAYAIIIFTIIIFILQVSRLLGKGVLSKLLLARYHKPVEEERIFMFLDLTSSSEIAEKLSSLNYSSFIKDFFFDLDDAIIKTRGSVFQYVGDEVVIIWKKEDGIQNNNCIKMFFEAKKKIESKKDSYISKYGIYPRFKAGLHFGSIVISEIGGTKQEIAYHGDTINTAARIRSKCHDFNCDLLISAEIVSILSNIDDEFIIKSEGVSKFKGKKNVIGLFSVKENK